MTLPRRRARRRSRRRHPARMPDLALIEAPAWTPKPILRGLEGAAGPLDTRRLGD